MKELTPSEKERIVRKLNEHMRYLKFMRMRLNAENRNNPGSADDADYSDEDTGLYWPRLSYFFDDDLFQSLVGEPHDPLFGVAEAVGFARSVALVLDADVWEVVQGTKVFGGPYGDSADPCSKEVAG